MSVKALFVDFYGTIVHEDGEVIKKITDIICKTGKAEDPSEVDTFWWKDFQTMFMNSFGETFETQRVLEERSLVHTLERFGSDADSKELSNMMFAHWIKPPIFEDSKDFFEKSPLPIYVVSNIDTPDILEADALPFPADFDFDKYLQTSFRMYGTKFTTVDLICKNDVMDAILDKFGKDVTTYCYDMENFRAEVDVVPSSVFYSWVFGFGGDVVINGPANVKEEYKRMVQKVADSLQTERNG